MLRLVVCSARGELPAMAAVSGVAVRSARSVVGYATEAAPAVVEDGAEEEEEAKDTGVVAEASDDGSDSGNGGGSEHVAPAWGVSRVFPRDEVNKLLPEGARRRLCLRC